MKCYFFQDDLRETLYGDPFQGELNAEKMVPYIKKNFQMQVNGQTLVWTYKEHRLKGEQVLVELFSNPVQSTAPPAAFLIENRFLTEKFSQQTNMVYLYYPDEQSKKAGIFKVNTPSQQFTL